MTYTLKIFGVVVATLTNEVDPPARATAYDVVLVDVPGLDVNNRDIVLLVRYIKALREYVPGLLLKDAKDIVDAVRVGRHQNLARALPDQKAQDLRRALVSQGLNVNLISVTA